MTDGGLGVTLGEGTTGGYLPVPLRNDPGSLGPVTPPSDILYNGALESQSSSITLDITKEAAKGEEELERGRLMRPEGRHHLVDIHGLAVFLRRSTRCLSCRAAFCLYVTGKISAQLAAVTQVKITCQKCNYTTSQTLSKPAGVPDNPSPQPSAPAHVPAPPPDTSTPPVPPPPPPYPQKPRHQTVIRLLKEENPSASDLLMKGKETPPRKVPTLPPLLPLRPIEKVWVKEEEKAEPPPKQDIVCEEGDIVLGSLDPLLTEWCQLAGVAVSSVSSSSRPVNHTNSNNALPRTTVITTTTTSAASRVSPSSLQQCASSPNSGISLPSPLGKPQEPPDATTTTTTITHRHLSTLQKDNTFSKGISFSSSVNPALSVAANSCSTVLPHSEGLFTILSGTPTPYVLPLASSLLQNDVAAAPDSPQLIQALEIKQKLERDLEESLRLVRRMIQLDPDMMPSSGKKKKKTRSAKECEESSKPPQLYDASGEALLGSLNPPRGMAGDLLMEGGDAGAGGGISGRRRERGKATAGRAAKSKSIKKDNSAKKATRAKAGRSRKRGSGGGGEDDEGNVRKRKKSTKAPSFQSSGELQETSKGAAASPAPPQCPPQTERCQVAVEQTLYDMLKHSLGGGGDGDKEAGKGREEEEWQERQCGVGSRPNARHHELHAPSCRCCSGPPSTTSPALLSLRSSLETWGHAHRILEGYSTRKRQKKGAVEASRSGLPQTPTLAQLLAALQQGTPASTHSAPAAGVRESPVPSIPDHVLDNLQRNLNQLVQKNSLRLALRSLVRRNASRTSRSKKYVKISVGVGEEEEEEEEAQEETMMGRMSSGGRGEREDRGGEEAGQEEGRAATWRFHDLLSSDSDSDPEDGRLVIDTEH